MMKILKNNRTTHRIELFIVIVIGHDQSFSFFSKTKSFESHCSFFSSRTQIKRDNKIQKSQQKFDNDNDVRANILHDSFFFLLSRHLKTPTKHVVVVNERIEVSLFSSLFLSTKFVMLSHLMTVKSRSVQFAFEMNMTKTMKSSISKKDTEKKSNIRRETYGYRMKLISR